ncbi:MAG: 2-oxoacid:acceptor oxidoreductase family protein [Pseudomonadota bacterium]
MLEIKFSGRGGQGVVMASQMLGYAFFRAGMYPQCYSLFGGERRGAPVVGFLRVDKEKILLKCEIKHPNELICFDAGLLNPEELGTSMSPGARILVCADRRTALSGKLQGFTTATVDARSISEELGLGNAINTAMLGAYSRFTAGISLDAVSEAVAEMVPAKREANLEAVRQGYDKLCLTEGTDTP